MNIVCWLIGHWWSFESFLRSGNPIPFSGHDYVEQDDSTLPCQRCGGRA